MTISLIPESAPFDETQRAWLNGFFAGMLGMEDGPVASNAVATLENEEPEEEEDFPWHDVSLPIVDRMKLAEDRPIERRMMAAMAQLNCGACGYLCQTYSEAIAAGDERNLTLCAPGGRETSKMLKKLVKEEGSAGLPSAAGGTAKANDESLENSWSRSNPYPAKLLESRALNGEGSSKDTRHVAIDLGDSGLTYDVGDALGIYPTNCDELIDEIVTWLDADADEIVTVADESKLLREALRNDLCLKEPTEELLAEMSIAANSVDERARIDALIEFDEPLDGCDVLDVLRMFPSARPSVQAFVGALAAMNPRLYSIASSLKRHDRQVHLTVGKVSWNGTDRVRKGVASTMLADRLQPADTIRVFVQKSHGFTVPPDPDAPMIMVGPGTGIAPFLAFLQEREAVAAKGKNWLLFGDQHRASDFIYESQLSDYVASGLLHRLDTAFSRDQEQKFYVQDRLRENGAEVWQWLNSGGYFFVCGDASRMAVDVDNALRDVIASEGHMSIEEAKQYLTKLADSGRYGRDVY